VVRRGSQVHQVPHEPRAQIDNGDEEENKADLDSSHPDNIPFTVAFTQKSYACNCRNHEAQHPNPRVGYMKVKHALHLTHDSFQGGIEKDHTGRGDK
jgi:hypothetical protein